MYTENARATPTLATPLSPEGVPCAWTQFQKKKKKETFFSGLSLFSFSLIFPRASRERQRNHKSLQSSDNRELSRCYDLSGSLQTASSGSSMPSAISNINGRWQSAGKTTCPPQSA